MRIKSVFLSALLLLVSYCSEAQMAVFQDEEDMITPSFRYDIIKLRRIASITINYEYKPDGEPILNDGVMKYFRFDSLGRVAESYFTVKEGPGIWDTVRSYYYYDGFGHIIIKRTNEGNFYDVWYYRWYADGNMKKRAHVREVPLTNTSQGDYRIGTQTVLSVDSFAYTPYPKQLQRYGYNEENKIYEKTITYYDDKHRMTSRNFHYAVGWLYSQVDLKYDDKDRVIEYTYTGNLNGEIHHTVGITYDTDGSILTEKLINGDKQTDNVEYMYDKGNGLVTNELDRDFSKSVINIARYTYQFR